MKGCLDLQIVFLTYECITSVLDNKTMRSLIPKLLLGRSLGTRLAMPMIGVCYEYD